MPNPWDAPTWDDRHAQSLRDGAYPRDPHPFLLEHAPEISRALPTSAPDRRKTALDIAAGLGRNTFWLAQQDFDVTATDVSPVAVDHLAARARAESLSIDARLLDLATDPLPAGPFDLIVNSMFLLRDLAPQIEHRLLPGGLLVFVTLLEGGAAPPVVHKEFLLRRGELATLFPHLHTIDLREDPAPPKGARLHADQKKKGARLHAVPKAPPGARLHAVPKAPPGARLHAVPKAEASRPLASLFARRPAP